jgi:hypothetical protein
MRIEGYSQDVIHPTLGTIHVYSGLDGAFVCTGEFWGPQSYADDPIDFTGAIIAHEVHIRGESTDMQHDARFNRNPVVGFVQETGLRLVAGSVREN